MMKVSSQIAGRRWIEDADRRPDLSSSGSKPSGTVPILRSPRSKMGLSPSQRTVLKPVLENKAPAHRNGLIVPRLGETCTAHSREINETFSIPVRSLHWGAPGSKMFNAPRRARNQLKFLAEKDLSWRFD